MGMNRRRFLSLLGLSAAGLVVPELIEPRRKVWAVPRNAPVPDRIVITECLPPRPAIDVLFNGGAGTLKVNTNDGWQTLNPVFDVRDFKVSFKLDEDVLKESPSERELRDRFAAEMLQGAGERVDMLIYDDVLPPDLADRLERIDMHRRLRRTPFPGVPTIKLDVVDPREHAGDMANVIRGLVESGHLTAEDGRALANSSMRVAQEHYRKVRR